MLGLGTAGLSARERNKLKRKSRALQRSGSQEGASKRSKPGNDATDSPLDQAEAEADAQDWQDICAGQWPFQAVCDQMCIDILDPVWQVSTRPLFGACLQQLLNVIGPQRPETHSDCMMDPGALLIFCRQRVSWRLKAGET